MWGRGSQLGSGEMAKHKPYKFACSTLRHLKVQHYENATQKTQSRRSNRRTDEVKTLKAKTANVIDSLIGGKQKQALQRMKTKHGNTAAQSRPPMRRPQPCIVSFLFVVALRAAQSTHSQFLSQIAFH